MSGNLVALRRRIKTVQNTQKLTKAMKTVSAAKLRRAAGEINRNRPYMEKLEALLVEVARSLPSRDHPLLRQKTAGATLLITVTSDKGLCGAFNSHLIRETEDLLRKAAAENRTIELVTVGNKGFRYFSKRKTPIRKNFPAFISRLTYEAAVEFSSWLQEQFTTDSVGSIEILATNFLSASKQVLKRQTLFPLPLKLESGQPDETGSEREPYILEPDAAALFDLLLPRYIHSRIYRLLLGSAASEEASRMVAMDLATRNASDMIRSLQLTLNKMRQAAITKELLEIMTATEALKK